MPRPQKFTQTWAWLAQQGTYYGCVAVSLIAAAATLEIGPYIQFLAAVGGNLVANLLERAAQGEDIPEDEVRRILESPGQLAAIEMLLKERGELLTVLREDIVAATQEMRTFRAESGTAHQQMHQQLDDILRYLQPPAGMTAGERQRVLEAYANKLLHSPHQRMSTGGLTAESARVADQIREPLLEDIFVEPHLTEAGSLRTAHEELTRLFETFRDEDMEPLTRDQARSRLLRLQSDTWEQLRKSGGARLASQALADKQVVVILGDPGSGKSTLLRWVLLERAHGILTGEDGPVPLYVAIGEYACAWERERDAGRAFPLEAYLVQRTDSECTGMQEIVTFALSDSGQGLLLLLDGLDEVPRELRRAVVPRLQDFLQSFVSEAQLTQVLVSSRFFGYEEAPITAPAVQMAVVPFDNEQIRAFARKWYLWLERHLHGPQANPAMAEQHAAQFEKIVLARPQIADLARNPLLLTMIAVVIRQGKRLPERRVELYDQALGQLMTQWEFLRMAARGDTTPPFSIDYNEACQLWAPIARWMHEVGTGAVHEEELKQRLRERLEDLDREETAQDWLTVRGDKCCLLQERGDKLFSFLHQTFQEYLAAMDIYQDSRFVDDLERYIADPRWHEVLRLACGYLGVICRPPRRTEVTELIRRIRDQRSPYETLLHQNLFLAASCIADDVKPRRETEQEIVKALLQLATSSAMDQQRLAAMELVVANARIPTDEALLQEVAPVLLNDQHWKIRYLFAQWLHSRPVPSASAFLAQLCSDSNPNVRCLALALSWRRNPTRDLLEQTLVGLRSMLRNLMPEAERILLQEPSFLAESLRADDPQVRLAAARLLCDTEERPQALLALMALLKEANPEVRLETARLLCDTEERPQAFLALVALLKEANAAVRWRASRLLRDTEERTQILPALMVLLQEADPQVRLETARLLCDIEERPQAFLALMALLKEADPWVRLAAARLLCDTEERPQAFLALVALLKEANPVVRLVAANMLRDTEERPQALLALVALLQEADPWVRLETARLLCDTEERPQALLALVALLQEADPEMLWRTAELLWTMADTKAGVTPDRIAPDQRQPGTAASAC